MTGFRLTDGSAGCLQRNTGRSYEIPFRFDGCWSARITSMLQALDARSVRPVADIAESRDFIGIAGFVSTVPDIAASLEQSHSEHGLEISRGHQRH